MRKLFATLLISVAAAGCGSQKAVVSTQPLPGTGPVTTTTVASPGSSTASPAAPTTTVQKARSSTTATSTVRQLTEADSGAVALKVGDLVELTLDGAGNQWQGLTVAPEGLLKGDPSPPAPPHGVRVVWTAIHAGTVRLTATGTAFCQPGAPCPAWARLFEVNLVIS